MRYVDIEISEHEFRISSGGSVYDPSVGGDTFSGPDWYVDSRDGRVRECDLEELEQSFNDLIKTGGKVSIDDDAEPTFAEE